MNEGDSRRATENIDTTQKEKVESTTLVLSAAPEELARSDAVLDHPLSEQMNEDNGSEASVRIAWEICIENVSCSDPEYATYEFAKVRLVWKTFKALIVIYIRSKFSD